MEQPSGAGAQLRELPVMMDVVVPSAFSVSEYGSSHRASDVSSNEQRMSGSASVRLMPCRFSGRAPR